MKREAFSLSITLWISAALMAGSLYFIKTNKENLKVAIKLQDKLTAKVELESTVEILKYYILLGKLEKNKIINKNQTILPPKLPIDATPFKYKNSTIKIQDTAGLLNTMYIQGYIKRMFSALNVTQSAIAIDSLDDWLDKDDFKRLNGAERFYYQEQHKHYSARNQPYLYAMDEINDIRGFENIQLEKSNFVHALEVGYNYYTMKPFVLAVLYGIDLKSAKLLVKQRNKNITAFESSFAKIEKDYIDELVGSTLVYSTVLKVTISTTINQAKTSKSFLIDMQKNIILYLDDVTSL